MVACTNQFKSASGSGEVRYVRGIEYKVVGTPKERYGAYYADYSSAQDISKEEYDALASQLGSDHIWSSLSVQSMKDVGGLRVGEIVLCSGEVGFMQIRYQKSTIKNADYVSILSKVKTL